jgi:hypothetical protein
MEACIAWLERIVLVLVKALKGWSEEEIKALAARAPEVRAFLSRVTTPVEDRGMSAEAQLVRWQKLYMKEFGMTFAVGDVKIPRHEKGFDRLIVVLKGIRLSAICQSMGEYSGTLQHSGEDLDGEISSIRTTDNSHYAVWVRARREADVANWNKAAKSFKQGECVTLEERLLYELAYFSETGQHLDVECVTICGGSRYRNGEVPRVYWDSDNRILRVNRGLVGAKYASDAVRSVVA